MLHFIFFSFCVIVRINGFLKFELLEVDLNSMISMKKVTLSGGDVFFDVNFSLKKVLKIGKKLFEQFSLFLEA